MARARRGRGRSKTGLLLLLLLAATAAGAYVSQNATLRRQETVLSELSARRDQMVLENAALQDEIDYTQTDEYILREARDKLGLLLEGEVRYESVG